VISEFSSCSKHLYVQNILKLKEARAKKAAAPSAPSTSDDMDVDDATNNEVEDDMPQAKRPKLVEESSMPPPAARLPTGFFDKPTPAPAAEEDIDVDDEAIQAVMQTMTADDLAETKVVRTRASNFDVSEVEQEVEREFDMDEDGYDEDEQEDAASALPSGFFDVEKRPAPKPKANQKRRRIATTQKPSLECVH
jgi:hypothetical protein